MSKRRHRGEVVWLKPHSGFVARSHLRQAKITEWMGACMLECGDRGCQEWDVHDVPGDGEESHLLPHVSECQMLDEKWDGPEP